MADADPAMLAQMLDTGPDTTGVMPYLGGVLKGAVWNPLKGAWDLGKRYVGNATSMMETGQGDPFLPFHDIQAAGSGIQDKLQDTFGNGSNHFFDTVAGAATNLGHALTSSDPAAAGEAAGGLIGPGDIAKGLGAFSKVPELSIWKGPRADTYSREAAATADTMREAKASPGLIYDETGMWHPPESFGQARPWQWDSDKEFQLTPMGKETINGAIRDQHERRFEHPGADPIATSVPLGDLIHPAWKGFEAYPGLKDMPVALHAFGGPGGGFSKNGIQIHGLDHPMSDFTRGGTQVEDTLLHEATHAVQQWEGMPLGGSPGGTSATWTKLREVANGQSAMKHPPETRELAAQELQRMDLHDTADAQGLGMYRNIAGEANAELSPFMKNWPDQSRRPFEMYGHLHQVNADPETHLINVGGSPPAFKGTPLAQAGIWPAIHGQPFHLSGPDLAKGLEEAPRPPGWDPNADTFAAARGFQGKAFRAEGFEGGPPPGLSAADVVRHEMERGNVDHVDPTLMKQLEGRPAEDLSWVGHSKEQLMGAYGPDPVSGYEGLIQHPDQIDDVSEEMRGAHVVHQGEEGTLLLRPSRRRR